jgi:glycosyltransferase involved in cell wall biosynthesis
VSEPAAILVAARDEEGTIAGTVAALKEQFPGAEVIVADDGSRDGTAVEAERAGARVVRLRKRGKGEALALG